MNVKNSESPVIVAALRTPLGRFHGGLSDIPAPHLAGMIMRALLRQSGMPPSGVDEVILGNVLSAGLGQNPARQAAAFTRIPFSASAFTVEMVCGSGLRAVCIAAQAIRLGEHDFIIAGGTENMSRAPLFLSRETHGKKEMSTLKYDGLRCAFNKEPMGLGAEWLAHMHGISRIEQDRYALASHRRAIESIDAGLFDAEVVPIRCAASGKINKTVARDECPRRNCDLDTLSRLRPAFKKGGTITAGNATPLSDGAAAVLVTTEDHARKRKLQPLARILSWCTAGVPPRETCTASIHAIRKLLKKNDLDINDIDIFEVTDSFAVQGLILRRELEWDPAKVNVRGGTLSLGHPLGASGSRILVTLLHILHDEKKRLGIAAICLGGGNAVAMLVENVTTAKNIKS
jgi:acetyl-CoA C-acetyltransferase